MVSFELSVSSFTAVNQFLISAESRTVVDSEIILFSNEPLGVKSVEFFCAVRRKDWG